MKTLVVKSSPRPQIANLAAGGLLAAAVNLFTTSPSSISIRTSRACAILLVVSGVALGILAVIVEDETARALIGVGPTITGHLRLDRIHEQLKTVWLRLAVLEVITLVAFIVAIVAISR